MQLLETLHSRTTKHTYKPNVGVVKDMIEFMQTQRKTLHDSIESIDLNQVNKMKQDRLTLKRLKHTELDTEEMRKKQRPAWRGAGSANQIFSPSSRLGPLQLGHWQRHRLGMPERVYRIPRGKRAIIHTHTTSRPIPQPDPNAMTPNIKSFAEKEFTSYLHFKERPSDFVETVKNPSMIQGYPSFRGDCRVQDFGFNKTLGTVGWKFKTGGFKSHTRNGSMYTIKKIGGAKMEESEHSYRLRSLPPIDQKGD